MGYNVRVEGILCAWINVMSIKQVDAPESSKVWDCIEVDPKQRLIFNVNPPDHVTAL